jgi:hypothetical protein
VDWRVKTFESEARMAFAFLLDQGFTATVQSPADVRRRPTSLTLRFISAHVTVEPVLSLAFAGEDAIYTTVLTPEGSSTLGPSVAHKGHEMRTALLAQAAEVRAILGHR